MKDGLPEAPGAVPAGAPDTGAQPEPEAAPRRRRTGGRRGHPPIPLSAGPAESEAIRRFAQQYPFPLDPFQLEAIRALDSGRSVLAAAPTGTGKTVIAEFGIQLAREQGLRCLYTSPIKALSNQKFRDWRARYGDVGLLTGDVTEHPQGSILVMTTEVLRNMLLQSPHALDDVACVVFDEVHFLADPERGTTWEEAILSCPKHVQLICLSATVANAGEVASWISHVHREMVLVTHFERAVPLEHSYYFEGELHLLVDAEGKVLPPLRAGGEARYPKPAGIPPRARPREVPRPREVVRALDEAGMLPAIYFLFGRRACELAAQDCSALDLLGDRAVRRARRERIRAYLDLLDPADRQLEQVQQLAALLDRGIAFHHAGLLPLLKVLVEELFAAGLIGVVFATETLALGINMPARTVVIAEPAKYDGQARRPLTPNEYSQLVGRAGRRGLDPKGYAVNLYSPWMSCAEVLEIITGELLPIRSAFTPRYNTVAAQWDGSDAARERLVRLFSSSLRQFQMNDALQAAAAEEEVLRARAEAAHFACPYEGVPDGAVIDYIGLRRELEYTRKRAQRAAAGAEVVQPLEAELAAHPCHACPIRREHERALRRELAALRALSAAEAHAAELEEAAASQAQRTLDALVGVLLRFGYLVMAPAGNGRPRLPRRERGAPAPNEALPLPAEQAAVLARVYDPNGLLLLNLAWGGELDHLAPAELMELLSWFCYDREGPRWNRHDLTPRLWELRPRIGRALALVQREERERGLAVTTGPSPSFYGPILAWCRGATFTELLQTIAIGEGDLLMAMNKTLDLATQLREALRTGAPNRIEARTLAAKLEVGDRLLRRGIVAQSLRLATALPAPPAGAPPAYSLPSPLAQAAGSALPLAPVGEQVS